MQCHQRDCAFLKISEPTTQKIAILRLIIAKVDKLVASSAILKYRGDLLEIAGMNTLQSR